MAIEEQQLAILNRGALVWNAWREKNPAARIDLAEANLAGADLRKANLCAVNLSDARLSGARLNQADCRTANLTTADLFAASLSEAHLERTDLRGADLRRANLVSASLLSAQLSGADLSGADLGGARLEGADLSGAYLINANLSGASLEQVNLKGAYLNRTVLANVDLSTVMGLGVVNHWGPSTIGIDTLYRSKNRIPKVFLHGCGLTDNFMDSMRFWIDQSTEFYSCFISHSSKDQEFCNRLYASLQAKGVRVWYFPEDAKWGEPVWSEIDRSIKIYDKLIVVCSENSLTSGPVQREMERALNREDIEHKNILFPVRIDDYVFEIWKHARKADVIRKVVGDFCGWDSDAARYEKAFDKLLKGLAEKGG